MNAEMDAARKGAEDALRKVDLETLAHELHLAARRGGWGPSLRLYDTEAKAIVTALDALRHLIDATERCAGMERALNDAETVVGTIVTNHFARITERGILVYGHPVVDTGFTAAISWLARRKDEKGAG